MTHASDIKPTRFDVLFGEHGPIIEPHFCREWDEDGGCYGTNPNHGMSLQEAAEQIAEWHKAQAEMWLEGRAWEFRNYSSDEADQ